MELFEKGIETLSIRYINEKLSLLDQQQLPGQEVWVDIQNPDEMVDAIVKLQVRGAPAIALAACLSLSDYLKKGASEIEYKKALMKLRRSRPTAVNLMWALDRLMEFPEGQFSADHVYKTTWEILIEDKKLCEAISKNGAELIPDGAQIMTHCNTGGLATAGEGTALGIIKEAHRQGKNIHVYVNETRPLLQGGRLTAWELQKAGIPCTLICDNMAAMVMASGKIHSVIVGADRVAQNGDFANKIGTYGLSILAKFHQVQMIVAAPYSTVDLACPTGNEVPIELREEDEVRGAKGSFGEAIWAPKDVKTYNPAFDVTPYQLVDHWIFDFGAFNLDQMQQGLVWDQMK